MVAVLADERLYAFTGGRPPTLDELRARYAAQVTGHSPDGAEEWRTWIVRVREDAGASGYVQATITDEGRAADVAWVIGIPWQRRGYASEAAVALVAWLRSRGVVLVTAHVHPDHAASAAVAERAGLAPSAVLEEGERVWRSTEPPG